MDSVPEVLGMKFESDYVKFAIFDMFDAISSLAEGPTVSSAEAATQDSGSVLDHI